MITNEHVVAMMKAAISETEDIPLFVSKKLFQLFFFLLVYPNTQILQSTLLIYGVERVGRIISSISLPGLAPG